MQQLTQCGSCSASQLVSLREESSHEWDNSNIDPITTEELWWAGQVGKVGASCSGAHGPRGGSSRLSCGGSGSGRHSGLGMWGEVCSGGGSTLGQGEGGGGGHGHSGAGGRVRTGGWAGEKPPEVLQEYPCNRCLVFNKE